jgi:aminoglycoside 3-N-acetyltransferase
MPNLNIAEEFTVANPPRFDVKNDPIKHTVGIIPQTFKTEYAEHFSLHPTHSLMGIGERAAEILAGHDTAGVPCGANTPWHKNALAGGEVLLIGVDQRCNTTHHCAEERVADTYQLSKDVIDGVVILDGREVSVPSRLHVWSNHPDFNIINEELRALGHLVSGPVGEAEAMLLDARGFLELALEKLARDVRYFLANGRRAV